MSVLPSPAFRQPPDASRFRLLSDDERQASLERALAAGWQTGQDLWIYGYGSLVWRPEFNYAERRMALLRGYHRSLCLWSRVNRGTPEVPGLVFGLDAGGSCHGVVFRLPAPEIPETMQALWRREMPSGSYLPRWLPCQTKDGTVQALAFTMNRQAEGYVRNLPTDQLVEIIRRAHGIYGSCLEYVLETEHALRQHGISDRRLRQLVEALHMNRPTAPSARAIR